MELVEPTGSAETTEASETTVPASPPQRLCNEIQLFDLCELDVCAHKDGRYCTKGDILAKFEMIREEDDRSPEQFMADELDECEGAGDLAYDDAFGVDEYEDEHEDE